MKIFIFIFLVTTCFHYNTHAAATDADDNVTTIKHNTFVDVKLLKDTTAALNNESTATPENRSTAVLYFDKYGVIAYKNDKDKPKEKKPVLHTINCDCYEVYCSKFYARGEIHQLVNWRESGFLMRNSHGYYRSGPGYHCRAIGESGIPVHPTDCARMSKRMDWLVTLNSGRSINLHRCAFFKNMINGDDLVDAPDVLCAKPYVPYSATNKKFPMSLNLFTQSDDATTPLACSFAFDDAGKHLALVFPHQVMLWNLKADDYQEVVDAKGQIIMQPLHADQPCRFDAAVFSPDDPEKEPHLYLVGNNFIWRYGLTNNDVNQFRYASASDLEGSRTIAISSDGERLAVADQHAGVVVFDTQTMALLCVMLRNSFCKHIALYHDASFDRIATSILNEDGSSLEALWDMRQASVHISLLEYCLNILESQRIQTLS